MNKFKKHRIANKTKKSIISILIISGLTSCNKPESPKEHQPAKEQIIVKNNEQPTKQQLIEKYKSSLSAEGYAAEYKMKYAIELEKLDKKLGEEWIKKLNKEIKSYQEKEIARNKKLERNARIVKLNKKKEGIYIGMSMQDVLDSSWGRPQRKTTYHTSMGENTIWQYGEYGERGTVSFQNGIVNLIQN